MSGLVAADLAAQRPVAEHRGLEQDLAVLGRVVQVRADLLDDDGPLALDVGVLEPRPDDELADHVHRAFGLAARDADPVDRRFAVRRGVERAADALDGLADRPGRRVGRRALEREVLHEMGDADLAGRLEPRAGEDVRGDRDRARRREPGADHAGSGWQRGPFEHPLDGTGLPFLRSNDDVKGADSGHTGRWPQAILRATAGPGTVRHASGSRCRAR